MSSTTSQDSESPEKPPADIGVPPEPEKPPTVVVVPPEPEKPPTGIVTPPDTPITDSFGGPIHDWPACATNTTTPCVTMQFENSAALTPTPFTKQFFKYRFPDGRCYRALDVHNAQTLDVNLNRFEMHGSSVGKLASCEATRDTTMLEDNPNAKDFFPSCIAQGCLNNSNLRPGYRYVLPNGRCLRASTNPLTDDTLDFEVGRDELLDANKVHFVSCVRDRDTTKVWTAEPDVVWPDCLRSPETPCVRRYPGMTGDRLIPGMRYRWGGKCFRSLGAVEKEVMDTEYNSGRNYMLPANRVFDCSHADIRTQQRKVRELQSDWGYATWICLIVPFDLQNKNPGIPSGTGTPASVKHAPGR